MNRTLGQFYWHAVGQMIKNDWDRILIFVVYAMVLRIKHLSDLAFFFGTAIVLAILYFLPTKKNQLHFLVALPQLAWEGALIAFKYASHRRRKEEITKLSKAISSLAATLETVPLSKDHMEKDSRALVTQISMCLCFVGLDDIRGKLRPLKEYLPVLDFTFKPGNEYIWLPRSVTLKINPNDTTDQLSFSARV